MTHDAFLHFFTFSLYNKEIVIFKKCYTLQYFFFLFKTFYFGILSQDIFLLLVVDVVDISLTFSINV